MAKWSKKISYTLLQENFKDLDVCSFIIAVIISYCIVYISNFLPEHVYFLMPPLIESIDGRFIVELNTKRFLYSDGVILDVESCQLM